MIIWLFALVLLGLLGLAGFYLGVVRVAISLVGLFVAALLAVPLSPVIKPILPVLGLKHPLWSQFIPALIIFVVVMIVFKVLGAFVHQKVHMYFKYKRDEKTFLKWERLSHRLGLCLGLVNGTVYFILALIPFYVAGYLTTQLANGAEDPQGMRFVNATRAQMHDSKVDRVVAAYDPAPANFYEASDVIGLVKNNPLLANRLSQYPVFLSLAEKPEFQSIANDVQLNEMIQRQAKVSEILNHPKVQAVVTNVAITSEIGRLLGSDLKDLHQYLQTGKSEKYDDEKILGRWVLNLNATVAQEKVANPKVTPFQLKQLRESKYASMRGITFVATTDETAFLKQDAPGAAPTVLGEGTWKSVGSGYEITLGGKTYNATFEDDKLLIPKDGATLVFQKQV